MSIRAKMLLSVGIAVVGIVLAVHGLARSYLLGAFSSLSVQMAREDVQRVLSAIDDEVSDLDAYLWDWAAWDDSVRFVETRDDQYIKANLVPSTFRKMRIDFCAYLTLTGSNLWSSGYDREAKQLVPPPDVWTRILRPGQPLTVHSNERSMVKGLLIVDREPVLICSRPIVTSDERGPVHGTMVAARRLGPEEIGHMSRTLGVKFVADVDDCVDLPNSERSAWRSLRTPGSIVVAARDDELEGQSLLRDIHDAPAVLVRTAYPRRIEAAAEYASSCFVLVLAAAGALVGVVAFGVQERHVIRRIAALNRELATAGATGLPTRMTAAGSDEVSGLAAAINGLLGRLAAAAVKQQELTDQLERRAQERTRELEDSRMEIRRLHRHVEGARENERRRVAQRVHDEVGQSLTVLKMDIEQLRTKAPADPACVARLADMATLVDTLTATTQDIAMELRPSVLDHLGLQAAVQWFAQRMEKRTGVACQVNADDFELDGELATFAFRAVQELLTNVLRHAGATRAWIRVRQPQEGGVRVEVEDNGRGLDEEHAFSGRSFGLSEVRERAHALGGTLTIERAASGGARVVIAIPARAGTRNKEA